MTEDPYDRPIAYIDRVRDYYAALGYTEPYRFAAHRDVPFVPLRKNLASTRVALVTTAALFDPRHGDQGPGAPYNAAAKFYRVYSASIAGEPQVRISHLAYDRDHTSATDQATWFPLKELQRQWASGRIGGLSGRFFGLPTNRSQRTSRERDCPELLDALLAAEVDAAILVANCPVCHQSVSLAARHLEANGIATVVMGCAKDIVELCGVPRFLFSDFPLGNAAGRPHDPESQERTLSLALDLLEGARAPRTTVQSPLRWSPSSSWKLDYCSTANLSPEEIARRRHEFDAAKSIASQLRHATADA